ncbi:GtrA family protein [Erythrobacter sp. BLCC-B19]|uniref:GtrA family protein n=1 Tax=Erythrobacter sp. BLCC-B19 TaxID=3025315 RepID=UPI0023625C95|nr:GtrA family protein [Erythrobacter sp. BLCC-B19]WDA42789.1 GtrA family protein [Erythrobacter sp. BLCC-B19]
MLARLFRFLLTGLANSAVGWAVIFGGLWAGMSGLAANAAGYAVGLVLSFTLNRRYVFGVTGVVSVREVARFMTAFAIAYGANVAVLLTAEAIIGADHPLAQLPALATYVLLFFVLSQRYVFRPTLSE